MRAYISADDNLGGHFRDYNENYNCPLSSRLGAKFDRLRVIQQQRAHEYSDDIAHDINDEDDGLSQDKENISADNTGDVIVNDSTDDDEYYEALFSAPSSATTLLQVSENNSIMQSHASGNKRKRMNISSYSSLALSTSMLAQREIDEAQKRIAELEQSIRYMTENHHDDLGSPSLLPKEDEEEVDDGGDQGRIIDSCINVASDENRCVGGNGILSSSVVQSVSYNDSGSRNEYNPSI